jgi:anti-sigma regulatory factor (Ser/Thr protein kinase)
MPGYTLAPGADARAVAAVLDGVEREAREGGTPPSTVDRVVLVAGEAVANAVEHGAGEVTVQWIPAGSGGRLLVSEGGRGPGLDAVQGARLPESTGATRGRGLFLIQQLSDRVDVGPDGLGVWFSRRSGE